MAVARKCDRCGTFYDMPKTGEVSGMLATTCHVTPATVSGNVSNFKIKYPVRYTELVAGYTKPAVEVTEGNQ